MGKQFDLEQQIMECWQLTADLDTLNTSVLEQNISTDDISNILVGLVKLYNLKFDQTFRTFEGLVAERYQESKIKHCCSEPWGPDCDLGKSGEFVKVSDCQDIDFQKD